MKNLIPYLSDESKATKLFLESRWADGLVACPYCDSTNVIRKGIYQEHFNRYLCKDCTKKQKKYVTFNDKTGTIYDGSQLSMTEWVQINFLFCLKQNKMEIANVTELNYQRVLRATRLIQGSVYEHQQNEKKISTLDSEHNEVDEMYITAGLKGNKEAVKRAGRKPRKRRLKKEDGEHITATKCL